ncbi:flagellar hook-associated protein FlgK [Clostridium cochlearium]|uniref:flagellar hook-associated protein FlgK n=1 Tax=Clostridium cochlearium TaxID=1494 RepID=UPI000B94CF6D|nr:flagellar hook-associated protein FlgK [Clostridium cochlearium]SNV81718.1 flagellar hook-associated protein 1 [Clostridium cochlearium]STA92956.1 flagellar hook-associated protein 1 [Clostridium cochlearium]
MSGLFGTLHVGKSGIFANQRSIDVTSHNIANANTEGYSRQRAELQTERPFCTPSMNNAAGAGQLGRGVNVADINRIRDTFLDYQVRIELGVQGKYAGRHKFLNEIENIFNEPSETGISTLLGNFFDGWQELSKQPHSSNARTVVAEQSKALTDELNHLYGQLHKLKDNAKTSIRQDLNDVNSILDQMERLNEEIIQVTAAGQKPNDLLDRRDLLLDKLSSKFGINIEKKGLNGIDVNTKGDAGAEPPDGLNLIQMVKPEEALRFAYISSISPAKAPELGKTKTYTITYYKNADMTNDDNKVTFKIELGKDEYDALDKSRTLWTNKDGEAILVDDNNKVIGKVDKDGNLVGEKGIATPTDPKIPRFQPSTGNLNGYMSVQDDIDNQIEQLDKLARTLAYAVNAVHSQSQDNLKDELLFFVNKDKTGEEGEKEITARNITVNEEILKDVMKIKVGRGDKPGETDGTRALAIANIMDKLIAIQNLDLSKGRQEALNAIGGDWTQDEAEIWTIKGNTDGMTFGGYFKDMVDRLGVQTQEAKRMVKNQHSVLASFQQSRDAVSGVSLDEEMTNLIQFQHAYQANAKLISTVDELLDVVVNGLKR